MKPAKTLLSLSLIVAGACAAAAHAKEVPVDGTVCWGGTTKVMAPAKDAVMGTYEVTGTARNMHPGAAPGAMSIECMGTFKLVAGTFSEVGYCVLVDSDGDKYWGLSTQTRDANRNEDSFEYLGGSGKYAGITGKVRRERPVQFPPLRPGVLTGCSHSTGSYTLPD